MVTTTPGRTDTARLSKRLFLLGAIGGMIAGVVMAMVEMIYGWLSGTHTLWDAPMAIWSWVFGLDHFGDPANHVWPIVLGMGAHMMNSAIVGIVFAALATAIRPGWLGGTVVLGVVYALVIWIVMRYVVLPLNDPEALLFTTDAVSPQWVWWLAHAGLGMTAGIFFHYARPATGAREEPGEASELRRVA